MDRTLYFTRTNALEGAVFARSLRTGSESQTVDSVYRWDLVPVDAGIYYVTRPEPVVFHNSADVFQACP